MAASRPYLAAALVCERVLQEKDDVLSAIRIVDTIWVPPPPKDLPTDKIPAIQVMVLLAFKKAGGVQAEKHEAAVRLSFPSGTSQPRQVLPVLLPEGEIGGANIVVTLTVPIKETGLLWFDVEIDDELMTRVPFRLLERAEDLSKTTH